MEGLTLINEARSLGLEIWTEGNDLVVRGNPEAGTVALKLLANKAMVMAALEEQRRVEHRKWLSGLSLVNRIRYDRAFGKAWYEDNGQEECRKIARRSVVDRQGSVDETVNATDQFREDATFQSIVNDQNPITPESLSEGRAVVSTRQTFGRDLAAAVPSVACRRNHHRNRRFYDGITINESI